MNEAEASGVYFEYIKEGRTVPGALILAVRDTITLVSLLVDARLLMVEAFNLMKGEQFAEWRSKYEAWLKKFRGLSGKREA